MIDYHIYHLLLEVVVLFVFAKISIKSDVTNAEAAFWAPTESTTGTFFTAPLTDLCLSIKELLLLALVLLFRDILITGFDGKEFKTSLRDIKSHGSSLTCGGVTGLKCGILSLTQSASLKMTSDPTEVEEYGCILSKQYLPPLPTLLLTRPKNLALGLEMEA